MTNPEQSKKRKAEKNANCNDQQRVIYSLKTELINVRKKQNENARISLQLSNSQCNNTIISLQLSDSQHDNAIISLQLSDSQHDNIGNIKLIEILRCKNARIKGSFQLQRNENAKKQNENARISLQLSDSQRDNAIISLQLSYSQRDIDSLTLKNAKLIEVNAKLIEVLAAF